MKEIKRIQVGEYSYKGFKIIKKSYRTPRNGYSAWEGYKIEYLWILLDKNENEMSCGGFETLKEVAEYIDENIKEKQTKEKISIRRFTARASARGYKRIKHAVNQGNDYGYVHGTLEGRPRQCLAKTDGNQQIVEIKIPSLEKRYL